LTVDQVLAALATVCREDRIRSAEAAKVYPQDIHSWQMCRATAGVIFRDVVEMCEKAGMDCTAYRELYRDKEAQEEL
jgi:hypothetical protein